MERTPHLGEHSTVQDPNLPNFYVRIKRGDHGSKLRIAVPFLKRRGAQRLRVLGILMAKALFQIPLSKPA
jgi:hypothetical protein